MTQDENQPGERANDRHEAWLQQALEGEGETYVEARGRLLAELGEATPVLESARLSSDADRVLVASAILGHARDAATYAQARGFLTGKGLPPARNVMGKHTLETLAQAIADLGEIIDPWLYETLFKSKDHGTARERSIVALAIERRASPRLLPVLADRSLRDDADLDLRTTVIRLAVRTGDATVHTRLLPLVDDTSQPEAVRAAAAFHLAERFRPPAPSLRPSLEAVLLATGTSAALKEPVVRALVALRDPAVLPTLHVAIDGNHDEELLQALCGALESIGDASSIPHIEGALPRIADVARRSTCAEDLETLRQRTRVP